MQHRETQGWEGRYGNTTIMTPADIKVAIKTFEAANEKKQDYDELAEELCLDIEGDAQMLLGQSSPAGFRQIIRRFDSRTG